MSSPKEEGSWKNEIEYLQSQIKQLDQEKQQVAERIKELIAEEDIRAGKIYADRIFELQRKKLTLEVEIDYRRKKINRIKLSCSHH